MPRVQAFAAAFALAATPALAPAATTESTNIPSSMREEAASEGARDLLVRADEALNALTYSVYRIYDQAWKDSTGTYKVDCSGYVNRLLDDAVPEAYDELRDARDESWPRARDYYYFFKSIPKGGTLGRWRRPSKLQYARPGDLLVYKYDASGSTTGHVMVIVSVPRRDYRWSRAYRVRVTDSARSGHSHDNRGDGHGGVGAGEMLVRVDSNGNPISYAWSLAGYWRSDVSLAVARPRY